MTRDSFLVLPPRIRADVAGYRAEVSRLCASDPSSAAFRTYCASMGVYEHRQSGRYMVRVRLGAGLARAHELDRIADLAATHGDGVLHVTTRQDIQIHGVEIGATADVQEGLVEIGLSARGGGGNTVRNVTACPRATVCPTALFDVAPYAIAAAEHLLRFDRSYGLPRKFKIAFSGCPHDCAFASVNDLGFFAHEQGGRKGFAVYAGGGLGRQPMAGVIVEEFIDVSRTFVVAEAVERLFDRLGDRTNRHRARLRYVLRDLGEAAFIAEYRKQVALVDRDATAAPPPAVRPLAPAFDTPPPGDAGAPDGFLPERDPARFTLVVRLRNGRIPAEDLKIVAQIARTVGDGVVVATQEQDLLVPGIRAVRIDQARTLMGTLRFDCRATGTKVVACTGASTCRLGLCMSPALADAIANRLAALPNGGAAPETIRISGCTNACGNHTIATLGFEGRARRHEGRLMPLYDVVAGGEPGEGRARFAERLGAVAARRIPDLVAEIAERGVRDAATLRKVVEHHAALPDETPDELFRDVGTDRPFSLPGAQ